MNGNQEEARGDACPSATPRTWPLLLRDSTFGPFFFGKLISTIGVWVHNIAAAIVVWQLTGSALLVGAVSIGQFLPQILLTPFSGALADRGDRRRQLVMGRLVCASGSIALVAYSAIIGLEGNAGAAAVITTATIVGVGFALGGPAMSALTPALVRPSELSSGIALGAMPFTIARATGPAIGALLVTSSGPIAAFGLAAVSNLVFAAILVNLRIRDVERPSSGDGRVRAALAYLRSKPHMAALIAGVATVGIGVDPVITLSPAVATRIGEGGGFVGVLASSFGIGAGLGFLLLGSARRWMGLHRLGPFGLVTMAGAMCGFALSSTSTAAIASLVVAGVGMILALTALTTQVQEEVPEGLRGRVMAIWSVAFLGSRPLAAGVTGAIADAASVTLALMLIVAVLLLGALLVGGDAMARQRAVSLP